MGLDSLFEHELGSVVAGRYRLLQKLGAGGMGSVYRAQDQTRSIEVALKFLHRSLGRNPSDREAIVARFAREAEVAARMFSRNIVRVLDRGIEDRTPFIVYELLEGEDLATHLNRVKQMPLAATGDVIMQVCRALERAHSVGVVHRDIKPANIFLVREEGRALIKVLDFGIAKVGTSTFAMPAVTKIDVKDSLPPGSLTGTLEHMSPEHLLDGVPTDTRGDLYAVGVVGYRCLTGRVPFAGEQLGQLVLAISRGPAAHPSSIIGGVPPAVDAFFARALHRDPAERFQNANEMAKEAVTAFRSKGPLPEPPPSSRRRDPREE